ncbi:MAG: ATP-binding cassette domain-containing protein [Saprospiraceae bacterium]|nr:ATP-binding cassette domain-containing protein [Saprospiraceae bacterium]
MEVLQTSHLHKSYGKIKAVNDLNLSIHQGMVFGLLGPNGSGKTTTLGIILGILQFDAGNFTWFENQYGEKHRTRIGAILETPNFYPYLNAIDNLKIVSLIKGVEDTNYDDLLKLVDLHHRKDSKFSSYSLGMKQRLAIAATQIGNPDVLIFDEPTNGLDPQGIAEVRQILKRIADTGKTVIMASHILDEVEKICSHVGIMKNGVLLASGPVGAMLNDKLLGEIGSDDLIALTQALNDMEG